MGQIVNVGLSLLTGDAIEYKTHFQGAWRSGFVALIERHSLTVRDAYTQRMHMIEPGRRGKVRKLSGRVLVEDVSRSRQVERAQLLPVLRPVIVRTTGEPVAVPRPPRRVRSSAYLKFVRSWPCLNCGAAAPSEAHHDGERGVGQRASDEDAVPLCGYCHRAPTVGITDTSTLPGRSLQETDTLIEAEQVRLLGLWRARGRSAVGAAKPA